MNRNARENVEYNSFAKTFSNSRKNMKWEEISYFITYFSYSPEKERGLGGEVNILDIGCGNGRLLGELKKSPLLGGGVEEGYLGIDLSILLLEEARKNHSGFEFKELNMLDLKQLNSFLPLGEAHSHPGRGRRLGWGAIFFIASFHHLNSIEDRLKVLKDAYNLLESGGMIFMTNWALDSELNKEKYNNSIIYGSENKFLSMDYNIKIGQYTRFYHCFSLEELEFLSKESGFKIIENKLFENKKNYILILKKS